MNCLVGTEKTSAKECQYHTQGSAGRLSPELTVQLFQGELLGLSDEAENHEPRDEVQTGIEAN